jgi:hypothetical protein
MKDLDFDELDRAVNSLISGDASTGGSESSNGSNGSSSVANIATNQPDVLPASRLSAPAVRRSGGRFMDVVHPSSNMRSSEPKVSRQGMTVQPLSNSSVTGLESPNQADEPSSTPNQKSSNKNESASNLSSEQNTVGSTEQKDDMLESPFLPDARVEKRPLGTFSSNDTSLPEKAETVAVQEDNLATKTNESSQNTESSIESTADDLFAENKKKQNVVPLPRELQSDLLSVESNVVEDKKENPKSDLDAQTESSSQPTAVISIPQQYQEQPSTSDQQSSPIYDVVNHHQPIAHPAKKKHSLTWLWILLVIVIIGGGIGVAIYLFDPFGLL